MKKPLKNQKGQMVVEMILLMITFVAMTTAVRATLQENEAFKSLTQGPWRVLSGMITSGAWAEPKDAILLHPNMHGRHAAIKGKTPNE